MPKQTVASVATKVAALRKETDLQDERIAAVEGSTTKLLVAMGRVETAIKKNGNGVKANGKKPKRMEILTATIIALVGLQSLGVIEGLRVVIVGWLTGGG